MSKYKVRVVDGFSATGKKLQQYYNSNIQSIVFQAATHVENEIILGISQAGTGRIYKRGSVVHQASSAGEYPATDLGGLKDGINIDFGKAGLSAFISSEAPYSTDLEFGTKNMAARPFMKPSLEKARPLIRKLLKQLVAKAKNL